MCVRICVYIHMYIYIYIYIYSVFYPFICSRTPRLFPYLFQINATISTGVKMLLWRTDFVSFVYIPKRGISESLVVLFCIFWETSTLFPAMTVHIYNPTINLEEFPVLHMLINICYLLSFWQSPGWQVWSDKWYLMEHVENRELF